MKTRTVFLLPPILAAGMDLLFKDSLVSADAIISKTMPIFLSEIASRPALSVEERVWRKGHEGYVRFNRAIEPAALNRFNAMAKAKNMPRNYLMAQYLIWLDRSEYGNALRLLKA